MKKGGTRGEGVGRVARACALITGHEATRSRLTWQGAMLVHSAKRQSPVPVGSSHMLQRTAPKVLKMLSREGQIGDGSRSGSACQSVTSLRLESADGDSERRRPGRRWLGRRWSGRRSGLHPWRRSEHGIGQLTTRSRFVQHGFARPALQMGM